MKVGIISAMDSEHRRLAERLEGRTESLTGGRHYVEGTLGGNHLVLTQCGIGKVNAAVGTAELITRFRPECVISTGVAGGIDSVLRVADVVVGQKVVHHDVWCGEGCALGQVQGLPLYFEGYEVLVDLALQLNNACPSVTRTDLHAACAEDLCPNDGQTTSGERQANKRAGRIHAGLICTGDRFITDRAELDAIKSHFPQGLAVDMESAAIAQVCYLYGMPFISFRIISDTPGIDDHLAQYADFWGEMADRSFATTWAFLSALPHRL